MRRSLFTFWVVRLAGVCSLGLALPPCPADAALPASPAAPHAAPTVPGAPRTGIAAEEHNRGNGVHVSLSSVARAKGSTKGRAKQSGKTPVQAYVFVPGVGTVVVSVNADGETTVARVPAHLNASNFTQAERSLVFRTTSCAKASRTPARHEAPRRA